MITYDDDINELDGVQFVNHYMPTEQDMHILTDDEFEAKLEELLDFVFGPEPLKYIVSWVKIGKESIFSTFEEAYDFAVWLSDTMFVKIEYQQRPYSNEIVVALIEENGKQYNYLYWDQD